MSDQIQSKNTFRLEGKVHAKRKLEYGMSNGVEWHKLEILLSVTSEKHNKVSYFPIIFWNLRAQSADSHINENDYIAVEGQIVTKEYASRRDNSLNYFVNLTGYKYEIITHAEEVNSNINSNNINNAPNIVEENYDDDVPF